MAQSWRIKGWRLGLTNALAVGGALAELAVGTVSSENEAFAQIKPDATLGAEKSVVKSNVDIEGLSSDRITGGARRGANLFHSFEEFSINPGQGAYFSNPAGIENILSRVTGNSRSSIQGTLGVLGQANLFLLNPNGVIFGPNSSLDVNGSFVATTADAIQFGDQGVFSASTAEAPPILTVNPSAFLFNQLAAQPIIVNSRGSVIRGDKGQPLDDDGQPLYDPGLQVPNRQSLLLLGGDVSVDRGSLKAPRGHVELGAVAGAGMIGLNTSGNNLGLSFPDSVKRADISLANGSRVDVRAGDRGSIAIHARNLDVLSVSGLAAGIKGENFSFPNRQAGNITVNLSGAARVADSSFIVNHVKNWQVSTVGAKAKGGNVNIKADSVSLSNGASVGASVFGNGGGGGDAGSVTINARGPVLLDGVGSNGKPSRVRSELNPGAIGKGGNVTITAGSLSVTNGAEVSTTTFGKGDAGNVTLETRDAVFVDGAVTNRLSGKVAASVGGPTSEGGEGKGGNVNIKAGSLLLINGARVSATTFGKGDAGSVTIETRGPVSVDGVASRVVSAVNIKSEKGNGGNVTITAGSLSVTNGAYLSASNEARGEGLIVNNGAELSLDNAGKGTAGNLKIKARSINLDNKAFLNSDTQGGKGNIFLDSQDLLLSRKSKITTNATGEATGGNITIDADVIVALDNSDITANALEGPGGRVAINAQRIFGTEAREKQSDTTSDITASSDLGPEFSGTVEINTLDVDPSQGIANLPNEPVNTEIAQDCQASAGKTTGRFISSGRGGLPTNPYEPLDSTEILAEVQPPAQWELNSAGAASIAASPKTPPDRLVEAKGWARGPSGEMILTAQAPTAASHKLRFAPVSC